VSLPESLRIQAREGRALAAEFPAGAGRRAFVVIRPEGGATTLEESLQRAKAEGALPVAGSFTVSHYEYDAKMLGGFDYDIGRTCHGEIQVTTVEEAEAVIARWGFTASELLPYHLTDAP